MVTKLKKKKSISKIHVACSNTDLFPYYEPWHIRTPGIFIIRGIFRTLEHSEVRRYSHPCQTQCKVFEKKFQPKLFLQDAPSKTILDVWLDSTCAYVSINATYLVQLFQVLFQVYSHIFEHYSTGYSPIFRTLCIPGIIRTLAYSYHKAYSDYQVYL